MKNIQTFKEFINESYLFEAKPSKDFGFSAKTTTDLKPGDFVWREMERHNPQLGVYYTLSKAKIAKVSGKKIFLDDYGSVNPNFYDRETGQQLKTSDASYGSAYYTLFTHQMALDAIKNDANGKYKRNADDVKSFKQEDATKHVNESINEGAVKTFEFAMKNLISNIRSGYGWIDPEYVHDTVVTDGEFDEFSWETIKDEVYQRLIDQNLLYYANDADPETKGQKVSKVDQIKESIDINEAASVPSNVMDFAKRKGSYATAIVKKVATWAEKAGRRISGGTAIGKNYSTIILDMKHQGSEIYINLDKETVELFGEEVTDAKTFKKVLDSNAQNESIKESSNKSVTKRDWDKADDEQRFNWLSASIKDVDEVEKLVDLEWNRLPNVATSNMVKENLKESKDEFVPATLTQDFEDLRKGDSVKINALDFTSGGDKETVESIRPDGKKMEIKKAILTVKI